MKINCPYCGAEYDVQHDYLGQKAACGCCGKKFIIARTIRGMRILGVARNKFLMLMLALVMVGAGILIAGIALFSFLEPRTEVHIADHGVSIANSPVGDTMVAATIADAGCPPAIGTCYPHPNWCRSEVRQVYKGGIVVVMAGKEAFVRTPKQYVDGASLEPGMYICLGTAQIKTTNGPKTMWAFEKLSEKEAEPKVKELVERERKTKEEKEKVVRLAAEKAARERKAQMEEEAKQAKALAEKQEKEEIEDQINRNNYTVKLLGGIDFRAGNIWIDNSITSCVKKVSVSNYLIKDIIQKREKGDWLEVFNLVCQLLKREMCQYERFPPKEEIEEVVSELRKVVLAVKIEFSRCPQTPSGATDLRITHEEDVYPLDVGSWVASYAEHDGSYVKYSNSPHIAYCRPYSKTRQFIWFKYGPYEKIHCHPIGEI